jgi:co-chaperonin GroES (HSP10)
LSVKPWEPKRQLRLIDQDPLAFIPHGDRLLVEMLDVDEKTAGGLIPVRSGDAQESEIGWTVGVIVNVGNGHRMDTPDQAVRMRSIISKEDMARGVPFLKTYDDETMEGIFMVPSTVPMPFSRGMVIILAKYAGSDVLFQGREYKIITQVHVLGVVSNLRLNVGVETAQLQEAPEGYLPAKVVMRKPVMPNGEATAETYAEEK